MLVSQENKRGVVSQGVLHISSSASLAAAPTSCHLPKSLASSPSSFCPPCLFIRKYLLSAYYVPGTVVGTGDTAVNTRVPNPALVEPTSRQLPSLCLSCLDSHLQ